MASWLLLLLVHPVSSNHTGQIVIKNTVAAFFAEAPKPQFHIIPAPPEPVQAAIAPPAVGSAYVAPAPVVAPPAGSHEDWMAAAGIAPSDYGYVNYIISREGHWDPCVVEGGVVDCSYSGSAGYGVCQSTPGNKMAVSGADWRTNPITQLRWCSIHAAGKGGWYPSYLYWLLHHNW